MATGFTTDRRGAVQAGLALSTAAASPALAAASSGTAAGGPVVELPEGKLRGYDRGGIHVFKGVPYGGSASGANRFGPPRPVEPWSGVRDATQFGPASVQNLVPTGRPLGPGQPSIMAMMGWGDDSRQDEDCLVLNVWTPGLGDGHKRPVMFRIHGGGFYMGSGAWPQSDGEAMARKGDVVVVTVNHRLGALGYLYLAEIGGARYADSGNAGMLDLVAALRWVQTNIARFGGDPGKVMIFGESGGGMKVSALLGMPAAKGLFHRAIVESGAGVTVRTAAQATAATRAVLAKLGIAENQLEKLDAVPARGFLMPEAGMLRPVVDGRALPQHPGDAVAAGSAAGVPVMIGYNETEGTLLTHLQELPAVAALDEAGLRTRLAALVQDGHVEEVIAAYRRAYPKASPGDLFLHVESSWMFGVNSVELAERKIQGGGAPVYMYRFAWQSHVLDGNLKAAHGLEVPFTMNNAASALALTETPGSQPLADRMSDAWLAFAKAGDPGAPSLPHWPGYTSAQRATMVFDNQSQVVADPFGDREVWKYLKPRPF